VKLFHIKQVDLKVSPKGEGFNPRIETINLTENLTGPSTKMLRLRLYRAVILGRQFLQVYAVNRGAEFRTPDFFDVAEVDNLM